jgi:hypothetical protein
MAALTFDACAALFLDFDSDLTPSVGDWSGWLGLRNSDAAL